MAFIIIISIFGYQCFKEIENKDNEIRVNKIYNAIDSTHKDMIIKKHEEDLDLAYIEIKRLNDKIKKLNKRNKKLKRNAL